MSDAILNCTTIRGMPVASFVYDDVAKAGGMMFGGGCCSAAAGRRDKFAFAFVGIVTPFQRLA